MPQLIHTSPRSLNDIGRIRAASASSLADTFSDSGNPLSGPREENDRSGSPIVLHDGSESAGIGLPSYPTPAFKLARPAVVPHDKVSHVVCIGSGHVGGPTSAVIAYKNPDVKVTVVDLDANRISAWNSSSLPIYEPGLHDIVMASRDGTSAAGASAAPPRQPANGSDSEDDQQEEALQMRRAPNLFFSTDVEKGIKEADLIFVSVNTPTKMQGVGKGSASDLGYLEAATRMIAKYATGSKIVVEKSTVPCRTAESIRAILDANARPGVRFDVLSNPEFLAEGTAVTDLLNPDRILIGSLPDAAGYRAAAALTDIYAGWIPVDRIITMNLWSSELAKLAANALLAQRISSINALSAICEATGADIDEVAYACGLDSRIGPRMLKAGPGFGGSCFKKDILNLVYLSDSLHLYEVAAYWRSVLTINEYQKDRFTKRIISTLFNNLTNKKIAVLGFSFKKDTGDTRESPAISLVCDLAAEKAQVAIYDPVAEEEQIWRELNLEGGDVVRRRENVVVVKSPYDACLDADAVVVMTEWDEFSNKISNAQSSPTAGTTLEMDPDRVGVSQLATSASSASIKSLNGKLERALSNGADGAVLPTMSLTARLQNQEHSSRTSTVQQLDSLNINSDGQGNKRLDWARVAEGMRKPMCIFDGRNILDVEKLEKLGFQVEAIGKAKPALRGGREAA